jgi:hypothetical protein
MLWRALGSRLLDARKELVVKIKKELEDVKNNVMKALRVREEKKKVDEPIEVEKEVVDIEEYPAVASAEASEATLQDEHIESSQPQAESILSAPTNSNIPTPTELQTTG